MLIAHLLLALQETAVTIPERPAPGSFVVDQANLLTPRSIAEINATAAASAGRGRPVYVVTIPSLAAESAQALTVPEYARRVFDAWRIGGGAESRGALLLVSAGDRTARIELGHAWNNERDAVMRRIMANNIVPAMRRNEPTEGIVDATANIASSISPWGLGTFMRVLVALVIAAVGWTFRRLIPVSALFRNRERDEAYATIPTTLGRGRLDPNAHNYNASSVFDETEVERRRRLERERSVTDSIWGADLGGGGGGSSDGGGSSSGGGGATGSW